MIKPMGKPPKDGIIVKRFVVEKDPLGDVLNRIRNNIAACKTSMFDQESKFIELEM